MFTDIISNKNTIYTLVALVRNTTGILDTENVNHVTIIMHAVKHVNFVSCVLIVIEKSLYIYNMHVYFQPIQTLHCTPKVCFYSGPHAFFMLVVVWCVGGWPLQTAGSNDCQEECT